MKMLYVCEYSKTCPHPHCSHKDPHEKISDCSMDCSFKQSSDCNLYYRAYVEYQPNRLSHGEDDPHRGTEYEGMYAGLTIEKDGKKYFFRCSDYQYDENVPKIIDELLKM